MKQKKYIVILSSVILILVTGDILYHLLDNKQSNEPNNEKYESSNSSNEEIKNNYQEEESFIENINGIIVDKNTGEEIFNPNNNYSPNSIIQEPIRIPSEIDEGYIDEYLKWFFKIYPEKSFESFSDQEIAILVSLYSNLYEPRTVEDIQKVAKMYFNIDNYTLPTGTYILDNFGDYTISKINGYYVRSSVQIRSKNINSVFFKDISVNENKIIVSYDYASDGLVYNGCYSPLASDEENEKCIIGYYKVYLTYIQDRLNIDKIDYIKKA